MAIKKERKLLLVKKNVFKKGWDIDELFPVFGEEGIHPLKDQADKLAVLHPAALGDGAHPVRQVLIDFRRHRHQQLRFVRFFRFAHGRFL